MILWFVGWAGVFAGRDWRVIPLVYGLLVAISLFFVLPYENDMAKVGLDSRPWEKILMEQALSQLVWAVIAVPIWFFRRRPADD